MIHPDDLGRLLSLISHEVRAPLGVMRGYLRMLEQGAQTPEQHRTAVAGALKASTRATDLLNQLSTLARLYRGEVRPALKETPLEPLLRSAVHEVVMPPEPVVTIHVGETPDVVLMADPDLLRTAVAGLTGAVVRAQAQDNRVFLLAREEAHDGERGVALTITVMEWLKATHEDRPLDLMRGGLGLDLPIAAYVVEAHRGHVLERRDQERFVGVVVWLPII